MSDNTFIVHQPRRFASPGYVSWNPHDEEDRPDALCLFWGRVLRRVDAALPNYGLRFVLSWDNDRIPQSGDDVVVIQVTDDRGRLPAYSSDVGIVFKQFGTKYPFPLPRIEPTSYFINNVVTRIAATLLRRVPYALRAYRPLFAGRHPHFVSLPGGYYHSSDDAPLPIARRACDIAFLGSLEGNSKYFSRFFPSVKSQVRSIMLAALERTAAALPAAVIRTRLSKTYNDAIATNPDEYTKTLFATKIALAPQGLASESYRYHEAVRAGAVVISGKMPNYSYFKHAPTITIDSWNELPHVASSLLADPERMQQIQDASLEWWQANCSEAAVASRMIESIGRIRSRRCSCISTGNVAGAGPARDSV